MTSTSSSEWSAELKAQTREAIVEPDPFTLHNGQLCFKHIVSGFGVIAADDLQRGVLRMVDRQTKQEVTFAGVDELIAAGWAID